MKRIILFFMVIACLMCCSACDKPADYTIEYNFSINSTQVEMEVGDTFHIKAAYSTKKIYFSCEERAIATVDDNGIVTAISEGTAYIKMTVDGVEGIERYCEINVIKNVYTLDFVLENNYPITVNTQKKIQVKTYKNGVEYNSDVTFTTSGAEIIKEENNIAVFKAAACGNYTVTAINADGAVNTLVIVVVDGFTE